MYINYDGQMVLLWEAAFQQTMGQKKLFLSSFSELVLFKNMQASIVKTEMCRWTNYYLIHALGKFMEWSPLSVMAYMVVYSGHP